MTLPSSKRLRHIVWRGHGVEGSAACEPGPRNIPEQSCPERISPLASLSGIFPCARGGDWRGYCRASKIALLQKAIILWY